MSNSVAAVGGLSSSGPPPPAAVQVRARLNLSIVRASLTVTIGAGKDAQGLLAKSAVEAINEELAPLYGPDALQNALGQDNSPEGTASRIVSLSTAFLGAFQQSHPDASLKDFMAIIRKGITRGFDEARHILQGLQVLTGDIASNIDKTWDLVQQKLADFEQAQSRPSQ